MVRNKRKILIVDDSVTILKAIESLITDTFVYAPYFASSFEEAKVLIEKHKFFTAILDLELPDSLTGEIVDYAIVHQIRPIVLTGTFNEALRRQILRKPIVDYIVKNSIEDIKNSLALAENITYFDQKVVLIVDDSKLARMQLRQLFEVLSFYVVEAASGNEAIEKIKDMPQIDVITIDYEMPGMDGLELIRKIRTIGELVQPMIFAVSSSESELDKAKFLKNGANDYFIKPAQKEEFNHKLGNYLRIVTQREELLKSQRIVDEYNRALSVGSYVTKGDDKGIITFVSEKFLDLTGYTKEELLGKPHNIFRHPNTPKTMFKELWRTILNKEIWSGVLKNSKKNGDVFYARTTIIPILNANEEIVEFVALRDDVSELIASQKKLQTHFKTDILTSLGNRVKLLDDLELSDDPIIALINIAGFKDINGEFGYRFGDEVLVWLGSLIHTFSLQNPIEVYRLNGDEFAVFSPHMTLADFKNICIQINQKVIETLCVIEGHTVPIKIMIGLSEGKVDTLLHADMALKEAKTSSNNIEVYHETIKASQEYKNKLLWKSRIIDGIKNDLFVPYFQPIIDNQTGIINKYEALIRLKDSEGVIAPIHFLEVAKKSRHYFELTMLMIRKTFQVFVDNDLEFSINLSVEDVENEEVILYLRNKLYEYPGIQKRLTIEIVESEGIENFDEMNLFIDQMTKMGCKIAIDDFGTGYSNFEYLMNMNIDYIKIDGSLIRGISLNSNNYDVIESIVGFAKKNNIKTVAEFVSNNELYTYVKQLGIDYSQGYYIGEPMEHLVSEIE
ncbi:MAG: EAL domain-containing protein [Sulfuricurvum sp.]|uniref:EAL domain-containing protein n=1 Tax=Sulfuricurvum sp. TaxID=2025608 RepID=UPI0025F9167E|nr:EAL domain-containing protein [Sulfuricurvum sp.]MBV5320420.1 EAL domain-containing protein [Sulfuricurvum sp.]